MTGFEEFEGKRILITGASSGIGAAVARALAGCGARLAICYNSGTEAAEALKAELGDGATLVQGDVTTAEGVQKIAEQGVAALDGLDGFVHGAGAIGRTALTEGYDEAVYDKVMDLNLRSIPRLCAALYPALREGSDPFVILTGSIAGRNGGAPGSGLYAAAKAATHSLTRSLAKEYAPDGIRVNAVAPGVILTPFHDGTSAEMLEAARKTIPLGRLGTAEECVGAYLFLASAPLAAYVTGQIIDVNGGQFMP